MTEFIWIDTSFLYALFARADINHTNAESIWKQILSKGITGVISNLILAELGTLLAYRFGHSTAASRIGMVLDSTIIRRVYVDSDIESGALAWWRTFGDQSFSFPDCVSFEIMRRTGMRRALSYDKDFGIAGFEQVRSARGL